MGQRSAFLREWAGDGRRGVHYWCQGCRGLHGVTVEGPGAWSWNGDFEKPTFTPSVLTRGILYELKPDGTRDFARAVRDSNGEPQKLMCHTFVTDGMVQFLADCGHEFAGRTLPLPPLPAWMQDAAD